MHSSGKSSLAAWLVAFTKSSQNNQHSPIDSANNKCYITTRTKEEGYEIRDKKIERKSSAYPSYQPSSELKTYFKIDHKRKGRDDLC